MEVFSKPRPATDFHLEGYEFHETVGRLWPEAPAVCHHPRAVGGGAACPKSQRGADPGRRPGGVDGGQTPDRTVALQAGSDGEVAGWCLLHTARLCQGTGPRDPHGLHVGHGHVGQGETPYHREWVALGRCRSPHSHLALDSLCAQGSATQVPGQPRTSTIQWTCTKAHPALGRLRSRQKKACDTVHRARKRLRLATAVLNPHSASQARQACVAAKCGQSLSAASAAVRGLVTILEVDQQPNQT